VSDAPLNAGEVEHHQVEAGSAAAMATALPSVLTRFAPDVVHLMAMSSLGLAKIAPLLTRYPWTFSCHSLPPYERKVPWWHGNESLHYATRALRFGLNTAAWRWLLLKGQIPQAIAHSRFVVDLLVRYGQDPVKISLIHLGFDLPKETKPPAKGTPGADKKLRLLTIAGLAHTKGQHDAIAALPELRKRFGDVEYRMIGEVRDRSYVAHLQKLATQLGVAQCLAITPNVSETEKLEALLATDVYVQPSHEEGFCLAYIEAAAVVPRLVGADTGAIAAISHDDEGARVVPVRSPKAIASAIADLIELPLPATLLPQRVKRLGKTFGWDIYLAAHEQLYRDLVSLHASARSPAALTPR
jgi:glycosyltransferase involved in cell wall biosynthesis